jgi:hypothetical protein
MSQPTHVNHGQVVGLANQMDELSHRAQDVLQRYEDLVNHGHSGGSLVGAAGQANLVSSGQIKEAQLKIQHRFQQVNDLLRQGASMYSSADDDNHQRLASLPSQMRWT